MLLELVRRLPCVRTRLPRSFVEHDVLRAPTEEHLSPDRNVSDADALLARRVRVPQGVVYRAFVKKTVILNLETGRYQGVNPTGGRVLDTLANVGWIGEAAGILAREYDRLLFEVQSDLCRFFETLFERGILVIEAG